MFVVGVTGGIGSGKSAVTDCFHRLGVPVIDADQVARQVVEPGEPALKQIIELFGYDYLQVDGHLDRRRLRERVFQDDPSRKALEALLHPVIRQRMQQLLTQLDTDYAIFSIPLLIETGQSDEVDRILVIDCPPSLQIERITQRDGISRQAAAAILASQCSREQRLAKADDIIDNSGTLEALCEQVPAFDRLYRQLARSADRH